MPQRALHIAAYDISSSKRLRHTLHILKGYATGGQKSVFECYLSDAERVSLIDEVRQAIDDEEDRFVLLRLESRAPVRALGIAVQPADPDFFYVG
ncbi:MAG: CRISPR-associated endonuclease Cas2 [Gammaproteobacteria bacterium]|nr:CRISPR-associated endonuclease Cas2 [Gammaproteobacteria bacterium]